MVSRKTLKYGYDMISICPCLKISLNLVPCRDTQAAWRNQSGGLQTADFGSVSARAPCVSHIISILFPYYFHIISIYIYIWYPPPVIYLFRGG